MANKPSLLENKPYYGFGNPGKPLETLGQCTATAQWRGQTREATFIVMKGRHQNLIGRSTAVSFGMVKLYLDQSPVDHVNQITKGVQFNKEKSGKLGCANDFEIVLEVDETSQAATTSNSISLSKICRKRARQASCSENFGESRCENQSYNMDIKPCCGPKRST